MIISELRIGVVGYCPPTKFNSELAREYIRNSYNLLEMDFPNIPKKVVSGLTNVGIIAIAYSEAINRNWRTMGVACSKANDYPCFPVDEKIIIGGNWGDESKTFLDNIDILVRVGGGKQAHMETRNAIEMQKKVLEYDLPTLD